MQSNVYGKDMLNMEPSPGRVCRVTPSASHILPLIPIKQSQAGEYGSWGQHLSLRFRERQLGMTCLSLWFLLLGLSFSFTVPRPLTAAHKGCVPREGRRAGHSLCTTQPGYVVELHAWECTVFAGPRKGLAPRFASCAQEGVDCEP